MSKTGDSPPSVSATGRHAVGVPLRRGFWQRFGPKLLLLATLILIVDALAGDKGLLERLRERQRHHDVLQTLEQMQHENSGLREQARRLREEDPATIEDEARRQLGMIKPGEMLFIIKDLDKQAATPGTPAGSEPAPTAPAPHTPR